MSLNDNTFIHPYDRARFDALCLEYSGLVSWKIINKYNEIAESSNYQFAGTYLDDVLTYGFKDEENDEPVFFMGDSGIKERAFAMAARCESHSDVNSMIYLWVRSGLKMEVLECYEGESLTLRLQDWKFWKRHLRKLEDHKRESSAINNGLVKKYISAEMNKIQLNRAEANIQMMKSLNIVNCDTGGSFTVFDAWEKSLSNPRNRRSEMMVRIKGIEQVAIETGMDAVFLTLTCPSKYHPSSAKYQGFSPKQAQEYLCGVWARYQAVLAKAEVKLAGLRVAEPHKDGCPHWHILAFVNKSDKELVVTKFKDYALKEDGEEKGADGHRATVEYIDYSRGTAVGYVAKYVSKNIDGHGLSEEEKGQAQGVTNWAKTWGINQFNFFGCPSIQPWREFRRLSLEELLDNDQKELLKRACHNNDFADYIRRMGGLLVKRAAQTVKLLKLSEVNEETGEIVTNKYKEIVDKVFGLIWVCGFEPIYTRLNKYSITVKSYKSVVQDSCEYESLDSLRGVLSELAV